MYLNNFYFFKKLNDKLLNLTLLAKGYSTDWNYLIKKSSSNIFRGEEIFISKFDFLKIQSCIDVGANIGEFSNEILKNSNTKVAAFEPLPECMNKLKLIEQKNPNRFKAFNYALSNESKDGFIYHGNSTDILSSLETSINHIDYVGSVNKNKTAIKICTLDEVFKKESLTNVDYLKIDVEGHELKVLLGAQEFLKKNNIKIIQLEFNWHHLMTKNSIFEFSQILKNYTTTQLNLVNGKVEKKTPKIHFQIFFTYRIYFYRNYFF